MLSIACVECHVDPGLANRLEHKIVALGELKTHLTGDPQFPLAASQLAPIPNERCQKCHRNPVVNKPGFSHAQHAGNRPCVRCHYTAGHSVTTTALAQAGILNPKTAQAAQVQLAALTGGAADLPNHVPVACSDCHRMSETPCQTCHTQPADHAKTTTPACETCHQAGEEFVFTHPTDRSDCQSCHTPAENHFKTEAACTTCHTKPGVDVDIHPHEATRRLRHLPRCSGEASRR